MGIVRSNWGHIQRKDCGTSDSLLPFVIFDFVFEMVFYFVFQIGLELLGPCEPPASTSQAPETRDWKLHSISDFCVGM